MGTAARSRTVTVGSVTTPPPVAGFYGTPVGSLPNVEGGGPTGTPIRGTKPSSSTSSTHRRTGRPSRGTSAMDRPLLPKRAHSTRTAPSGSTRSPSRSPIRSAERHKAEQTTSRSGAWCPTSRTPRPHKRSRLGAGRTSRARSSTTRWAATGKVIRKSPTRRRISCRRAGRGPAADPTKQGSNYDCGYDITLEYE